MAHRIDQAATSATVLLTSARTLVRQQGIWTQEVAMAPFFLEGKENTLETQIVAEANLESIVTSHVELRHHTEREFE